MARSHLLGWYGSSVPGSSSVTLVATSLLVACGLAACGQTSAVQAPRSYRLELTAASFPTRQHLPTKVELKLTVRNPGTQPVPAAAVTIAPVDEPGGSAFQTRAGGPDAAAAQRPVWIVDRSPGAGPDANRSSWTVDRLGPRATRTLSWRLIPVRTGTMRLRWTISGIDSSTLITDREGSPLTGVLTTTIDRRVRPAMIESDSGSKIRYRKR